MMPIEEKGLLSKSTGQQNHEQTTITIFKDYADQYYEAGYSVIPLKPGTKRPAIREWTNYCTSYPTKDERESWQRGFSNGNIGLALGQASGIIALDYDYNINGLHEQIEAVLTNSPVSKFGAKGRTDFYRYNGQQSRKWTLEGKTVVELLSVGKQCVLPPSLHPDTGQAYSWHTEQSLLEITPDELPELTEKQIEHIDAIFQTHSKLLRLEVDVSADADIENVKKALEYISPDNYETWIQVGMALKDVFGKEGYTVWDTWSKKSPKYIENEPLAKWNSFKKQGYTVGTIFHLAKNNGFEVNEIDLLEDPIPLRRQVGQSQPFPFDALGGVLGNAAKSIYRITQAPAAICAQSILAVAALIVQAHANIEIDGREYPLSLYMLTVANSGERKSAVDAIAIKPIKERQKELMAAYQKEKHDFDIQYAIWQRQRDKVVKNDNEEERAEALADLGEEPLPPVKPFLTMEEPTFEGLVKHYEIGSPSVGLFSDEGGCMIGGHSMNSDNQLKTVAGLSKLWGGGELNRVRAGDGAIALYNRRLTVHLMMQDIIFSILLNNTMALGQGFLARCLIVFPETTVGTRTYIEENQSNDPEIKLYWNIAKERLDNLICSPKWGPLKTRDFRYHADRKEVSNEEVTIYRRSDSPITQAA